MAAIIRKVRLTSAESFWYLLGCVCFGVMYLAKAPFKKAVSEITYVPGPRPEPDSVAVAGWAHQARSRHARQSEPLRPLVPAQRRAYHDQRS